MDEQKYGSYGVARICVCVYYMLLNKILSKQFRHKVFLRFLWFSFDVCVFFLRLLRFPFEENLRKNLRRLRCSVWGPNLRRLRFRTRFGIRIQSAPAPGGPYSAKLASSLAKARIRSV